MQMNDSSAIREDIVDLIPRLRRFAFGLTGNHTDADDVVQIALERSLTRLHQFKPGTRLDSWMFRIVQNCWFNECRRKQRTETGMDMTDLERLPNAPATNHSHRHDQMRDIMHAMSYLNDNQRSRSVMSIPVSVRCFRIVQNCWFNECRRKQRTETGMDMTDLERLPNAPATNHSHRHDQMRDIMHAMSYLNDDQRSLVMTVLVEGYSYKEAADLLEIPMGTVMSRLTRARKTLMNILSDEGVAP